MPVAQKIHQVMKEAGYIQKDGQLTGGGNYKFLSEEKVTSVLHDAFEKAGLVIAPIGMEILEDREDTTRNGGILHNTRIRATYRLMDAEDGDSLDVQALGEGSDSGDKTLNKCMTAAYKYVLRQTVMISTGNDPDNEESQESTQTARRPQQQPTRPAQPADEGQAKPDTSAARAQVIAKIKADWALRGESFGVPTTQWGSIKKWCGDNGFECMEKSAHPTNNVATWFATAENKALSGYVQHNLTRLREEQAKAGAA